MDTLLPGINAERVPTNRLTVNVLSIPDRTGPAVLFVHGNVSSSLFWQPMMLALPDEYRPLAIDLRGVAPRRMWSPAYAAPEVLQGGENTPRSDLASLGYVLVEMLAGQPPFTGPSTESVAHQHLILEPRLVSALRATVPDRVARELHRGLAKAAADRPGSAAEFVAGLSTAVRGSCTCAGTSSRAPPAVPTG